MLRLALRAAYGGAAIATRPRAAAAVVVRAQQQQSRTAAAAAADAIAAEPAREARKFALPAAAPTGFTTPDPSHIDHHVPKHDRSG